MSYSDKSGVNSQWLVLSLALCLGIQAITPDLYLPALPLITKELHSQVSYTQLTLSMLLVFFGIGQLIAGPMSDKWGRRPILIGSLIFYSLAAFGAALAQSMFSLILWRAFQGFAMSGAVVCARALPRDLYQPEQAASAISKGLTGLGVIACFSPVVGGLLVSFQGWRSTLLCLTTFGLMSLIWIIYRQPETLKEKQTHALNFSKMTKSWFEIIKNPKFQAFTLLSAGSYGGLFVFLATSSFIFTKVYGQDSFTYGLWLISSSVSYICGTFVCRRLLKIKNINSTLKMSGALSLFSGLMISVLSLLGYEGIWYFMPFHITFMIAHGINLPCATAGAVGPFPTKAGTAAALSGFIMMIVAFLTGLVIGGFLNLSTPSVYPLTLGMGFWSLVIGYTTLILLQRKNTY